MSHRFLDVTDHSGPVSVSDETSHGYHFVKSLLNESKTDDTTWTYLPPVNTLLKPEDAAAFDSDSQSSSDEYFSQTSETISHPSPLSESWSDLSSQQSSSQTLVDKHDERLQITNLVEPARCDEQVNFRHDQPRTNKPRPQPTKPIASQIQQDVALRPKLSSNGASQLTGGLILDTSLPAADAQLSRMRTEPKLIPEDRSIRRRNFSAVSGNAIQPPKLRRDTDQTDAIVKMIVLFCTNLISSIWANGTVQAQTTQSGSNVLPLQTFITETLRRSKTSYSTLQIALYYLILLKQALPNSGLARQATQGCRALQCGRRMFLTALILASKYLQDRNYSARAWSKISGLPLKEINENERRYLSIVCWNLHVPKAVFENWSKIVLSVCRLSIDAEACAREPDFVSGPRTPPPGSGPSALPCPIKTACQATLSALQNWWSTNLKSLCTEVVKCPKKTGQYVDSIVPFRSMPLLSRPIIDEPWCSRKGDNSSSADYNDFKPITRLPSIETMTKSFYAQDATQSPAMTSNPVTQRLLTNLPTPQQTPYDNGMWTPQIMTKQGLRTRPSASALAGLDQRRCPLANRSTCPPPAPRAQENQAWTAWRQATQNCGPDRSTTSSPDSVVSETSSVFSAPGFARSRSSSMSSSASWMLTEPLNNPLDTGDKQARRILEDSHVLALQQPASRMNALSLNAVNNENVRPDSATPTQLAQPIARKPAVLDEQITAGIMATAGMFAARALSQSNTPTQSTPTATHPNPRAWVSRPRLEKCKTQPYDINASTSTPSHPHSLKRSRTTSVDIPHLSFTGIFCAPSPSLRGGSGRLEPLEKEIVNATHSDKQPRKPVSCGDFYTKRTALTVPSPSLSMAIQM